MSCHRDNNEWADANKHCDLATPPGGSGVILNIETYPSRDTGGNYVDIDRDAVMYPWFIHNSEAPSKAMCGKLYKLMPPLYGGGRGGNQVTPKRVYEHVPNDLSFFPIKGDMWFCYLFDTAGYFVGTPCKMFETIQRRDSWPDVYEDSAGPPDPETGEATTVTTQTQTAGSVNGTVYRCTPCTASIGQCVPNATTVSYVSPDGQISGDPNNPYPTIWAVGTNDNYIVFEYDNLVDTIPDGINAFSLSIDGSTMTQMWDGDGSTTAQSIPTGNWAQAEGGSFGGTFAVIDSDIDTGSTSTGASARIVVRIKPIIDDYTNDVYTFGGSLIDVIELDARGTGYSVGQTFNFTYTFTHEDSFTTTWNFSLQVDSVTDYDAPNGSTLALLQAGDIVNGHEIVRALHTDLENFRYQVCEIDGAGSMFSKDTSYTSSRNHNITVFAGKGIADRGAVVGLYEFRNKNIQYLTKNLNPAMPSYYDDIVEPVLIPVITNGKLTDVIIEAGGSGLESLPKKMGVTVSPPPVKNGKQAKVKVTFTNGVVTDIKIKRKGSGYSSARPPSVAIEGLSYGLQEEVVTYQNSILPGNDVDNYYDETEDEENAVDIKSMDPAVREYFEGDEYVGNEGIGKAAFGKSKNRNKNLNPPPEEGWKEIRKTQEGSDELIDVFEVRYFRPKKFKAKSKLADGSTIDVGEALTSCSQSTEYKYFQTRKEAREFAKEKKEFGFKCKIESFKNVSKLDFYDYLSDKLEFEKSGRGFGFRPTDEEFDAYSKKDRKNIREDRYGDETEMFDVPDTASIKKSQVRRRDKLDRAKFLKSTTDSWPKPDGIALESDKIFKHVDEDNISQEKEAVIRDAEQSVGDWKSSRQKYQDQYDEQERHVAEDLTFDENVDEDVFFRERDVEVRTVEGSFARLPCATRYVKYMIRQYVPDSREKEKMSITLSVSTGAPLNCVSLCPTPPGLPSGFFQPDEPYTNHESVTATYTLLSVDIYGGCQDFTASGDIDILNDFSSSATLFQQAAQKHGNPFPSICDNQ